VWVGAEGLKNASLRKEMWLEQEETGKLYELRFWSID